MRNAGGQVLSEARPSDRYLLVSLPASALPALSGVEGVEWIEEWVQPIVTNNVAQGIIGVHETRQRLGLYGEGQIIAIADSGLDTGSLSTLSDDFGGRILAAYALRRPGEWSDLTGHGTHAIGIAAGSGELSGSDPMTHSYDTSFAGVAPESQIVIQSIGDNTGYVYPPLALSTLFQPTYDLGARVHSDSWGWPSNGGYTYYSQQVDDFINTHRDFIAVFPMGNDGKDANANGITDPGGVYSPATAKNCLAVGATENVRSDGRITTYGAAWSSDFPAGPIRNDYISNNADGMVAWSCRGPCADQRIKPDVCAPGTNIVSARSHAFAEAPGWVEYDADYVYWGGTSMSTPMVAGSAVLVREYYVRNKGISPSSALVKATLLNGATDIHPGQYAGQVEVPKRPNNVEGWGRVNVASLLDPPAPKVHEFVDEGAGLTTAESKDFEYNVLGNTVPLAITLVWTDPPASSLSGKQLVNDLDLRVLTPGGQTLMGNGGVDTTNNVESIDIASPTPGTYRVTVSGRNVPSGPQTFALCVSGELPGAYIAGRVTTATGKPVSGVLMTLADGGIVFTTTTDQNGSYTVHAPVDNYIVIPAKQGWTFDPQTRVVALGESGMTGVDFTGTAASGEISGSVTRAVGGRVNYSLESDHPYAANSDTTYTITAHPDAPRIRVHLDEVSLQDGNDFIYVLDADDELVEQLTGDATDHWTPWVTGNTVKINLVSGESDYSYYYGFHVDGYETDILPQGALPGITVTAQPGGATAVTESDGTFAFADMEPVTYTLSVALPNWKLAPNLRTVTVPPGGSAAGQNFLAFPPGTVSGAVTAGTSDEYEHAVASPDPYENNSLLLYDVMGPPGCVRLRVHFDYVETEPGFDFVDVLDAEGNIVDTFTGTYSDVWSSWVTGEMLTIRLETDGGKTMRGFSSDLCEAITAEHGVAGVTVSLGAGLSAQTGADGLFTISDVPVGEYHATAGKPYMTMIPDSRHINVVSGVNTQGVDFYAAVTDMPGIAYVKSLPNGEDVRVAGKAVTAGSDEFEGFFYIEEDDRFSGIRVATDQVVQAGDLASVTGVMATSDGERCIEASKVEVTPGAAVVPDPLGLTCFMLGGRPVNLYTAGVTGGVGLNNMGLLVRCWGRVSNPSAGQFTLTDGTTPAGVKVICEGIDPPDDDSFVQVTAISSCEMAGTDAVRVLRARRDTDIVPLTAP